MATCLIHTPHLFPLFSSSLPLWLSCLPPELPSFLITRVTPHENVTAAILSYAVSHLHEGTGKLRKTCSDTVGHLTESVPSLTISEKWPSAQRFDVQAADRRSPIQVLTQRKAAWLGWSPGTRHLPHNEHCRWFMYFMLLQVQKFDIPILEQVFNKGVRVPDKFGYPMFGSGRVPIGSGFG